MLIHAKFILLLPKKSQKKKKPPGWPRLEVTRGARGLKNFLARLLLGEVVCERSVALWGFLAYLYVVRLKL